MNWPKDLRRRINLSRYLKKTAGQWPYSSVAIELNEVVEDKLIFEHPSLKYTYIDRIIQMKDKQRSKNETVTKYIHEVAGEHIALLWPRFETL